MMIIILIFLLIASPAWGFNRAFLSATQPVTCSAQATMISVTQTDGGGMGIYTNRQRAQEFTTTSAGQLYSIIVNVEANRLAEAVTLTMRVGTSNNLGTYLASTTYSLGTGVTGEIEFLFTGSNRINLSNSTKYVFGLSGTIAFDNRVDLEGDNADGYADNALTYNAAMDWNIATVTADGELYFKVKICD